MNNGDKIRVTDLVTDEIIGEYEVVDYISLCDSKAFCLKDNNGERIAIRLYGNDHFRYGMREVTVARIDNKNSKEK